MDVMMERMAEAEQRISGIEEKIMKIIKQIKERNKGKRPQYKT